MAARNQGLNTAAKISFGAKQPPPQPYYSQQEKQDLEANKQQYKTSKRVPSESMDPYSDSEEEYERKQKQAKKPPKKKPLKQLPHLSEAKDDKESKGLLAKVADVAKSVVQTKEKKIKIVETYVIIELPRDILTAFFLLRLPRDESRRKVKPGQERPPFWKDYSNFGHAMLWISVLMPYSVQWFVLSVLVKDLWSNWDVLKSDDAGQDFWYNTCAFAVLFLYMWKDAITFYCSVWKYISYLQRKKGGIMTNLAAAASSAAQAATEVAKQATGTGDDADKDSRPSYVTHHQPDESKTAEKAKEAVAETRTAMKFIEFKLWLVSVICLYVGLTLYSLLKIPLAGGGEPGAGLVDKLEVSLSIFFVLEVDDWAYQLFIAQANILEDEEFDVVIKIKKDRKQVIHEQQKHLARTISLVIGSISLFWVLGWALNHI